MTDKPNEHKLRTLEDVLRVVTPDNLQCFLKDFNAWLTFTIGLDVLQEALDSDVGIRQETRGTMHWIDDGKNDAHISFDTHREV